MTQSIARPQTPRRTQAERRDESDRGLVHAAITVVAEEGVAAATFQAIGERAGYSRGLATQRFGSKRGLIEAVINHLHERQEASLVEHGIDDMAGFEAVLAYVDLYLRALTSESEGRAYFRLLSSAVADTNDLRGLFAAEHRRVEQRLEGLVLKGQAEGEIRREIDADAAALMIGSLLLGLSIQVLVDPETNMEPIRKTSIATLRQSFGVRA